MTPDAPSTLATWVALGDSFTAGTGDAPEHGGWVSRAAAALADDGLIDELYNLARPGVRIDAVQYDQVPLLRGEHAIVSAIAGANDVLDLRWNPLAFRLRATDLLGAARLHGRLVLASTCPDFFAHRFGALSKLSRRVEQLNALVASLAEDAGDHVAVLDTHRVMRDPAMWHADGIHPNPEGHRVLSSAAVEILHEGLCQPGLRSA